MVLDKGALAALALLGAFSSVTAISPVSFARAEDGHGDPAHERHFDGHIEGHIAFLKAELAITSAQEELWGNVAAAMRADTAEFERLRSQHAAAAPQAQPTALQHLEEHAAYSSLRAKSEERFLDAFRPLYEKLSDAQKQKADELLGQRREEP